VAAGLAAAAFTGVALTTARLLTPDAYLDLYAGRWIAAHGLPGHDPFTVEGHGRAWIDQQWLAHLLYYRMWQLGGYPLVGALSALLVAIAVGVAAWLIARRTGSPGITLAVLIPAYLLMLTHTQIWAESFAMPLFAMLVALIYDDQRQPDTRTRLLLAIPLLAVWANLHGTSGRCHGRDFARIAHRDPGDRSLTCHQLEPAHVPVVDLLLRVQGTCSVRFGQHARIIRSIYECRTHRLCHLAKRPARLLAGTPQARERLRLAEAVLVHQKALGALDQLARLQRVAQ
jgi:hypothetical protein